MFNFCSHSVKNRKKKGPGPFFSHVINPDLILASFVVLLGVISEPKARGNPEYHKCYPRGAGIAPLQETKPSISTKTLAEVSMVT